MTDDPVEYLRSQFGLMVDIYQGDLSPSPMYCRLNAISGHEYEKGIADKVLAANTTGMPTIVLLSTASTKFIYGQCSFSFDNSDDYEFKFVDRLETINGNGIFDLLVSRHNAGKLIFIESEVRDKFLKQPNLVRLNPLCELVKPPVNVTEVSAGGGVHDDPSARAATSNVSGFVSSFFEKFYEKKDKSAKVLVKASEFELRGELQKAVACIEDALAKTPKDSTLLLHKAKLLLKMKKYDEAVATSDEVIFVKPKLVDAYESKFYAYFCQEQFADCLTVLNDAQKKTGKSHTIDVSRGMVLSMVECHEQAIACFKRSDTKDVPTAARIQLQLLIGRSQVMSGQFTAGLENLEPILIAEPDSAVALASKIEGLIGMGQFDDAEEELEYALNLHPKDSDILCQNALLHARRDGVIQALGSFLSNLGEIQSATIYKFWSRLEVSLIAEMAEVYRPSLIKSVFESNWWKGNDASKISSKRKQLIQFLKLIGQNTYRPETAVFAASNLRLFGEVKDGLQIVERVREFHPKNHGLLVEKSALQCADDEPTAALETISAALKQHPKSTDMQIQKLAALVAINDIKSALPLAEKLHKSSNNHPDVLAYYVQCLAWEGQYEEVLTHINFTLGKLCEDTNTQNLKLFCRDFIKHPVIILIFDKLIDVDGRENLIDIYFGSRGIEWIADYPEAISQVAEVFFNRKQTRAALKALDEGILIHPNYAPLWLKRFLYTSPNPTDKPTKKWFAKAIASGDIPPNVLQLITTEILEDGVAASVKDLKKHILNHYEENAEMLSAFGWGLLGGGMHEGALGFFDKALKLNPDQVDARSGRAYALFLLDQDEIAYEEAQGALLNDPQSETLKVILAYYELESANYEKVLEVSEGVDVNDGAQNRQLRSHRSKALINLSKYEEAQALLEVSTSEEPEVATWHLLLAKNLRGLGKVKQALESAERAVELEPDTVEPRYEKAECLGANGRVTDAITYLDSVQENVPDYDEDILFRAKLEFAEDAGLFDVQANLIREKLTSEPENTDHLHSYIWALMNKEPPDWELALEMADRHLAIEPNDQGVWLRKGELLNLLCAEENAMDCFRHVIALQSGTKPDQDDVWIWPLAWANLLLGQYDDACNMIQELIEAGDDEVSTVFDLAICEAMKGDEAGAKQVFDGAVSKLKDAPNYLKRGKLIIARQDIDWFFKQASGSKSTEFSKYASRTLSRLISAAKVK